MPSLQLSSYCIKTTYRYTSNHKVTSLPSKCVNIKLYDFFTIIVVNQKTLLNRVSDSELRCLIHLWVYILEIEIIKL